MKKQLSLAAAAFLIAACGDTVENINQTGMEVVSETKDLPKCTEDNEGDLAFVKKDNSTRVCVNGEWFVTTSEGSAAADFSCKTEELKDKSGLKIVCNGDSIGVVLNGSDGKDGKEGAAGKDGDDGKAGTGCMVTDKTESTVTVACGDSTMVVDLGVSLPNDTAEADSERTPISLDSLVGFTQKGPFLKGSTVYLYELSDGRTLKQTGISYATDVVRDDGLFLLNALDLSSQYAMLVVEGFYRNEVSGKTSDASIRLNALIDLRNRDSANVNVLTHLEYERIRYLVTRKKMTVEKAKRQAQKEVLAVFGIELEDYVPSEDLNVLGTTDADAALLAISILLLGDSSTVHLKGLLAEISAEIAKSATWRNDSVKVNMADWALSWKIADVHGDMASWGLKNGSDKHNRIIDDFIAMTYGIESCATAADGSMRVVENKNSRYYGDTLYCKNGLLNEYYAFLIDNEHVYGTVTSTSGNTYRTVVINGLEIMAENMRDEVSGRWFNLQFVNGDSDFTDPYGFLYEIVSASGICPVRWRLPSKDEMDALIAYVGSENVIASKHLRVSVWADGDNQTGFNGLPAGVLTKDHDYIGFDSFGVWWTGTRDEENECNYAMMLTEDGVSLVCTTEYAYASVRCIKDYE